MQLRSIISSLSCNNSFREGPLVGGSIDDSLSGEAERSDCGRVARIEDDNIEAHSWSESLGAALVVVSDGIGHHNSVGAHSSFIACLNRKSLGDRDGLRNVVGGSRWDGPGEDLSVGIGAGWCLRVSPRA